MRKRNQAILINENAKKKIINELSLLGRTEKEQKFKLHNFYEEFITDNDIEINPNNNIINNGQKIKIEDLNNIKNNDFKDEDNDDNESIEFTDLKLPVYDDKKIKTLPNLKFQIINKSELSNFNYDRKNIILEKKIKIKEIRHYNNFQNKFVKGNDNKINNKINSKLREKEKLIERLKNLEKRHSKILSFNKFEKYLLTERNQQTIKSKKKSLDMNNNIFNINNNKNNIKFKNNYTLKYGTFLKFRDIIDQIVFWTEENKNKKLNKERNKGKKKRGSVIYEPKINIEMILPKVNSLQLFNINKKKVIKIKERILEIQKQIKNKENLSENNKNIIKEFLSFQNEIINENNGNINKISNELENIDNIIYGDNWSIVKLNK